MKDSVTCAMIKDLLPNYLEGLTSEETNTGIKEHIKECSECAAIMESMREPERDENEIYEEKAEIDFLKKNRQHSKRLLLGVVAAALVVCIAAVLIPVFKPYSLSYREVELELSVGDVMINNENVENGILSVTVKSNGNNCIRNVDFSEKDGIVTVKVTGAKDSIFSKPAYETKYNAGHTIKEVRFDEDTIWAEGVSVSDETLRVYKTAHPYVGNAVQNGETLAALGVYENLGAYKTELKTDAEPYGMIVSLEKPIVENKEAYSEKYMGFVAYNCLALIDNLSNVTFKYQIDGEERELSWDLDSAFTEFGKGIKAYGKSGVLLESLKWDYYK